MQIWPDEGMQRLEQSQVTFGWLVLLKKKKKRLKEGATGLTAFFKSISVVLSAVSCELYLSCWIIWMWTTNQIIEIVHWRSLIVNQQFWLCLLHWGAFSRWLKEKFMCNHIFLFYSWLIVCLMFHSGHAITRDRLKGNMLKSLSTQS